MLRGPQRGIFDLDFQVPSACADHLAAGTADIGIVPVFELTRQDLQILPGAGIACHGPVQSILLVCSRPVDEIATVAVDSSSRTSVQLARVILGRKYGTRPALIPHAPDLQRMLTVADAALIIGDPALRLDRRRLPYRIYDLGAEWTEMTGYPMVFAVWAGRKHVIVPEMAEVFLDSYRFGREHIDEIVAVESERRGFPVELVREYLTSHIVHELSRRDYDGMELFLQLAGECAAGNLDDNEPAQSARRV